MSVLQDLEPQKVFTYFEEIAQIPHGSTNTKQISDYLVSFAQKQGLKVLQDDANNVIIWKKGSAGYENAPSVILQGHMDMVCEKDADCDIDMDHEGLRLRLDGKIISAEGTTLGGDDGIAVAYILAILSDDTIAHPPIEAVITVDEEIGMLGAAALDMTPLQSRIMLNIDSEDEGIFLASCAGGATETAHFPIDKTTQTGTEVTVKVTGGLGGHSGTMINQGRANASVILGRVLAAVKEAEPAAKIIAINGGAKDNAIPREAAAQLLVKDPENIEKVTAEFAKKLQGEFYKTDPDLTVVVSETKPETTKDVLTKESADIILTALRCLPNGIQRMSFEMEGLVQTSLNLGVLKTEQSEVTFTYSVRSSVESEKDELIKRIVILTEALGGKVTISGDYPAWEYRENSPLRDTMVAAFSDLYGHDPIVQAIHAGVECGLFSGRLDGLDCISFGPDMKDIHTSKESMDADSVRRTWELLTEVLKRLH